MFLKIWINAILMAYTNEQIIVTKARYRMDFTQKGIGLDMRARILV